jgi:nicotinate-nucleotide adenylyltransferase
MVRRRAAIYGGTFDPVHNGHLEVARRVRELFELDEVIFVPACLPPHKRGAGISSAFHRFAMLALATQDDERFRISTIELDEPDRPYAVDTVSRLQDKLGSSHRLFFLIGADSWAEIEAWREWQRLLRICDLIVVTRPGYQLRERVAVEVVDLGGKSQEEIAAVLDDDKAPRVFFTDGASVDIAATAIRARARSNDWEALQTALPRTVANYIAKYELYKD